MKKKINVSLDDLKVESYITSIDADKAQKIAGGVSHPTHTKKTDKEHVCTGVSCSAAVAL